MAGISFRAIALLYITLGSSSSATLPHARLPAGFTAALYRDNLADPRGLAVAASGDLLVVERGGAVSRVRALWDSDGDGSSSSSETVLLATSAPGLNHGVALSAGFLFASSDTTVYRWPYDGYTRGDLGPHTIVINNINADGSGGAPRGHTTRTLEFGPSGQLFVSVGSAGNVDANSLRSRVRVFPAAAVTAATMTSAIDFFTGTVWADGLRNEVGLATDDAGALWGVENGADGLQRADLGGDIHNDNPGEELNKLDSAGAFYGYPYCWSEYCLSGERGRGVTAQWAWPSFMGGATPYTDKWCSNLANVQPPKLVIQAHSAPLGIAFLTQSVPCQNGTHTRRNVTFPSAFPCSMRGDAFVALHGSWNRDVRRRRA